MARVDDDEYLWTSKNDHRRSDLPWLERLSFEDWVKIKYGRIDATTKEKIWRGCMSKFYPIEC